MQATNEKEKRVWGSKPSQVENIVSFFFGIISLAAIVFIYTKVNLVMPDFNDSSSIINASLMGLSLFLSFLVISAIWKFLVTYNTGYLLTSQRLLMTYGVFNKDTDTLELYRVKDFQVYRPFFLRLFSLGNLVMNTSDASDPYVQLSAIKQSDRLLTLIRRHVEACRVTKGVRALDVQ